jgi:hypothetical protein
MTLQHFRALTQNKQNKKLLTEGVCIADRKTDEVQALLFQIEAFYVEVFFTGEGDEVLFSRSFEDVEELDPYLQTIDLSEVI